LQGKIPPEIGALPKSRILELGVNNLIGTIPHELLHSASNLSYLALSGNSFTGTLSSLAGRLSKLRTLDLGRNRFAGYLPSELFDLSGLKNLFMERNQFSGELSSGISGLSSLEKRKFELAPIFSYFRHALNFSHFLLHSLSSCTVSLADNSFTGMLPSEIGEIESLTEARFSNNLFSGPIPESLWVLFVSKQNHTLELEGNALTGVISNITCEGARSISVDCSRWFGQPKVSCPCCQYCDPHPASKSCRGGDTLQLTLAKSSTASRGYTNRFDPAKLSADEDWKIFDKATQQKKTGSRIITGWTSDQASIYTTTCVPPMLCFDLDVPYQNMPISGSVNGNEEFRSPGSPQGVKASFRFSLKEGHLSENQCSRLQEICGNCLNSPEQLSDATEDGKRSIFNHLVESSRLSSRIFNSTVTSPRHSAICNFVLQVHKPTFDGTLYQQYIMSLLYKISGAWSRDGLPEGHLCSWKQYITCDHGEFISSIDLRGQGLTGTLPSELGDIISLQHLLLSNNSIAGTIPIIFEQLKNLVTLLDLGQDHLTGSFLRSLPPNLRSLNATDNLLRGSVPEAIGGLELLGKRALGYSIITMISKLLLTVFSSLLLF
jgi:hypothetical protein